MEHKIVPDNPVIYEIYPRSFKDDGDSGIGSLQGIIDSIPYLKSLNMDVAWLSPFYSSPLVDGGYDVADYKTVNKLIGTNNQFEELVHKLHQENISVIIDLVFNHTSKKHDWFEKSRNRESGYEDYYVWEDAKPDGTAPNNWLSKFGQPSWTWDHIREQYYLHMFLGEQPNLNLWNEAVHQELKKIMLYWRAKGVDGFRLDAVTAYLHDEQLRDNPVASNEVQDGVSGRNFNPYTFQDHQYDMRIKEGVSLVKKLRSFVGDDCLLMGEVTVNIKSVEVVKLYTGEGLLDHCYTTDLAEGCDKSSTIVRVLDELQNSMHYGWWLSSHDQPRHNTELDSEKDSCAKFFAMLMAVMPGAWVMYQGEELGLPQLDLTKDETTDPFDLLYWPDAVGREGARIPMPWTEDASKNYGFTEGKPWLPMRWKQNYSVEIQKNNEDSVLNFYRKITKLRKSLNLGQSFPVYYEERENVLFLTFKTSEDTIIAIYNFSDTTFTLDDYANYKTIFASQKIGNDLPEKSAIWYKTI